MTTEEKLAELKRLYLRAVESSSRVWCLTKDRDDGTAQVYSPSLGMCRQIVPVAETTHAMGELIVAMYLLLPELVLGAAPAPEVARSRRQTSPSEASTPPHSVWADKARAALLEAADGLDKYAFVLEDEYSDIEGEGHQKALARRCRALAHGMDAKKLEAALQEQLGLDADAFSQASDPNRPKGPAST